MKHTVFYHLTTGFENMLGQNCWFFYKRQGHLIGALALDHIATLGNVCAVITLRDSGHDKGKIIPSCQTAPGSPCQKCLFNKKSRGHLIEKIRCQPSPIWTQYSPILPGERGQGHTIARVGGENPILYLYGCVPPNGVMILKLLI